MGTAAPRYELQGKAELRKEHQQLHKQQAAVSIVLLAGLAVVLLFYVYFKERENKPFKNLQDDSRI